MEYVSRCKSKTSSETHKRLHGAIGDYTLCGKELNEMWYLFSKAGMNLTDIDCPICTKKLLTPKDKIKWK